MQAISFVIIIIIGIVISIVKVSSGRKRREENERREQEKRDAMIREAQRRVKEREEKKTPPRTSTQKRSVARDPFPSYRVKPFDENVTYASSLSAAQLNEWLLDFAAAEKAGAPRPEVGKIKPLFARYLYDNDFNYRLLRKIRGYTPQNRLGFVKCANKIKPQTLDCDCSNGHFDLPLPEKKLSPSAYLRQKSVTVELPKKNFKERRQMYESFYLNKN